jgi:hypothetical protein
MLQNLSLDKTVRPRWRRLPIPSRFFLSVQAYAAGHHDAALRAAPAPAVPRPIWARAPEEVEQLLAGAILRDAAGAAVVAASPVVVQAPDVHGAMAPHVSVHTSAAGTTLLTRDMVQRFAVRYLPRVGLPGYSSTAGGVQITAAFAFNGVLIHRVAVSSPGLFDDRTATLDELAGHVKRPFRM